MLAPVVRAASHDDDTTTPIKHVIVIYGENLSFDHLFATYEPDKGQTVRNLLSEGIIDASGQPGPNFAKAIQYRAKDTGQVQHRPGQGRGVCDAATAADGHGAHGAQ